MTLSGPVVEYPSIGSTQDEARRLLTGIHWTTDQTAGRGRFDRVWHAEPGQSVAVSLALPAYQGFEKPYLIGMWVGLAVAEEFDLGIQWPNDLVLNGKKVSGLLTEIVDGVPIVGIGINVGRIEFPPALSERATSFANEDHLHLSANAVFDRLVDCLRRADEVPSEWSEISLKWQQFDRTKGKVFRLQDGPVGMAKGVSSEGELLLDVGGEVRTVPVAEALWGANV